MGAPSRLLIFPNENDWMLAAECDLLALGNTDVAGGRRRQIRAGKAGYRR